MGRVLAIALAVALAGCSSSERRAERAPPGIDRATFRDAARAFAQGVAATDLPETRSGGRARIVCRPYAFTGPPSVDKVALAEEVARELEETGRVQVLELTNGVPWDYRVQGDVTPGDRATSFLIELVDRAGKVRVKAPRAYSR